MRTGLKISQARSRKAHPASQPVSNLWAAGRPVVARAAARDTVLLDRLIGGEIIVRKWRARASSANREGYPEHFLCKVLPALAPIEGFLGATLLEREAGEQIEFVVLTRWVSMAAVGSFAGRNPDLAVVDPEATAALLSFDPTVRHYRVLEEVSI